MFSGLCWLQPLKDFNLMDIQWVQSAGLTRLPRHLYQQQESHETSYLKLHLNKQEQFLSTKNSTLNMTILFSSNSKLFLELKWVTFRIADNTSSLCNYQYTSGNVPDMDTKLKISLSSSTGHSTEITGSRTSYTNTEKSMHTHIVNKHNAGRIDRFEKIG